MLVHLFPSLDRRAFSCSPSHLRSLPGGLNSVSYRISEVDFTSLTTLTNTQLNALYFAVMLEQSRRLELRLDTQEACNKRLDESHTASRH